MNITLEQVDQVIDRTGVSYKEAKEALEHTNGDVLEAIVYLEQGEEGEASTMNQFGQDIIASLKDMIKKGNVTRIYLDKDGKTVVDIPVTAGALGAVFFAGPTVVAIIAALATGCELKIVKEDGEVINVKDVTKDTLENVKEKINEATNKHHAHKEEVKEEEAEEKEEVNEFDEDEF